MIIYVVTEYEYEPTDLIKAFRDKQKAVEFMAEYLKEHPESIGGLDIDQVELVD